MTTMKWTKMAARVSASALAAWSSGCVAERELGSDDTSEALDTPLEVVGPRSASTGIWQPHTYYRQQCNPEEPYSRPPTGGYCDVELRLVETAFASGQGASEGRGELSTEVTATPTSGPGGTTVASVPEDVYTQGESKDAGLDLGTYRVPVGASRDIEVCATFTEHDHGGSNGGDDVGSDCATVTLSCTADGQASFTQPLSDSLCGEHTCRGSASALVEVMRADADGDGVANKDDFTPEPCDELDKGLGGRAVLLYFHYGDDKFTTFFQSAFTNLSQVYAGYDYVVLVADNAASNPNNTSGQAFRDADRVFPPTREGLLAAMRHLTAENYSFDVFGHAHGYKIGGDPDDSKFEVISGHSITGNWLESATEPDLIGTARNGVPIVAYWSTTCISARQIDSWIAVGAKVASGAIDVQFYPNAWGGFVDNWLADQPYRTAVDDSLTAWTIFEAEMLVDTQGKMPPFLCSEDDSVLLDNVCADDFFNDDIGPNDAEYNIWEVYDTDLPGSINMAVASTREFLGNQQVTIAATGQIWP